MKRGIWWACFLVCASAHAQDGARFRYIAPPECPSEQQFRELIRARLLGNSPTGEPAQDLNRDLSVSVEVRLDPAHHRATLLLEEPDAAPIERVVEGDSCEELASGLSLIAALAFGAAREPASATTVVTPPSAEPAGSAQASAGAAALEQPARVEPAQVARDEEARSKPKASTRRLAVELGAGSWVNSWSAWGLGLGADLFVGVAPKAEQRWSLRASVLYGFGSANVGGRVADFNFFGGRFEGCPLSRSYYRGRLESETCLGLEMGALRGSGQASSALLEGASDTVFSATALLTGRTRVRLARRFFFELQGDLGVPLVHHEFVFEEPRERIFRTPSIGFAGRIGLGVQFP